MTKPTKPRTPKAATNPRPTATNALAESAKYVMATADDAVPEDIDVFRLALARRMLTFIGMPRRCRERICRRTKSCAGPDMRCQRDYPAPQATPDEEAREMSDLLRAIKRRLAQSPPDAP